MKLLAIDPGSTHSAYVVVDTDNGLAPLWYDKVPNEEFLTSRHLANAEHVVIEMVAHYGTGMPAGKTVFDTCVWIGRYWQKAGDRAIGGMFFDPNRVTLIPRKQVVTHICGSGKAGDGNVIQALIDRFAPEARNHGKGVKNQPEHFYGFHTDIWQAYALAVYYADTHIKETSNVKLTMAASGFELDLPEAEVTEQTPTTAPQPSDSVYDEAPSP